MKKTAIMLLVVLLIGVLAGCAERDVEQETVRVVLWHYYNDSQKDHLDKLIAEYNETRGAQNKIEVEAYGQGTVNELCEKVGLVFESTNDVTAMDMFLAYRDITVQVLEEKPDGLVDFRDYLSKEELEFYNESYLQEGYFDDQLYILPLVKSTELLLMNQDRLEEFQAAAGDWDIQKLETWEGIAETAQAYYEWTDAMTPEIANDGQAFLGIDVLANYFIVQNNALGSSIYTYKDKELTFALEEDVVNRLFETIYIPYTKGYYGAYGKFRSDDLRQSLLAGYIGSSSSIAYFPKTIMDQDGEEKAIRLGIYEYPYLTGGRKTAVQQGAGAAVVAGDAKREAACMDFLKWLTQEKGLEYASGLSYMPVGRERLSEEQLAGIEREENRRGIETGMHQGNTYQMVHGFDFKEGYDLRQDLTDYMTGYLQAGREEFVGYLEQGMSMEEASEAISYAGKEKAFYQGILELFERVGQGKEHEETKN